MAMLDQIRRAATLLTQRPDVLKLTLRNKLNVLRGSHKAPEATVASTLADVSEALKASDVRSGFAYGDKTFKDALAMAVPGVRWRWISHAAADVMAGAEPALVIGQERVDAVVVGGTDVKVAYANALRLLADR